MGSPVEKFYTLMPNGISDHLRVRTEYVDFYLIGSSIIYINKELRCRKKRGVRLLRLLWISPDNGDYSGKSDV